jgi:hypothetical protein
MDSNPRNSPSPPRTTPRNRLWIALAFIGVVFSWYYGFVVAPIGLGSEGLGILQDLYPVWNGSRRVLLHHSSPYSAAVTAQNQSVMYGKALDGHSEQQYAYPAFAAFPLAPLALLPFRIARYAAFVAFLILTPLSAMWWKGSRSNALLSVLLVLGAYPVILALQLRQPTLLFFPLIAAATAWVRSRPVLAGVLLALATAKPQLAIAACVPLLFWTVSGWRERRAFAVSFVVTETALLAAATLLVPDWFPQWLTVLSSYTRYNGRPLVVALLGPAVGPGIACGIVMAVLFVCWRWREDPWFTVSMSIAALQLIMPFQIYNEVMLLAPIFWIASHCDEVRSFGWIHQILVAAMWLTLAEGFMAVTALGVMGAFVPVIAAHFWKLPVVFAFFMPAIVFATLLAYVISATRSRRIWDAPRLQAGGDVPQPLPDQ